MTSMKVRELRGKFALYDKRGDNTLDFNELAVLMRKGAPQITDQQLRSLFASCDKKDGRIDFGDLVEYIFSEPFGAPKAPQDTSAWESVRQVCQKVYDETNVETAISLMKQVVADHLEICRQEGLKVAQEGEEAVSSNDATLIAYADSFQDKSGKKMPLACLKAFLEKYDSSSALKCIHMLPMFPWDTDRGFSVKDYYQVDPNYGTWDDVVSLSSPSCGEPVIMFDYVCNHVSVDNPWCQNSLLQRHLTKEHPQYETVQKFKDFVTAYADDDGPAEQQRPPEEVLARLTRPRKFPPLTHYFVVEDANKMCTAHVGVPDVDGPIRLGSAVWPSCKVIGRGYVWTTFSRGTNDEGIEQTRQIDLNYRNPIVLAEVIRVLLFYVRKGSRIIRLDAIGYIWKVLGSNSIHERGTHMLLAIFFKVLRLADPSVMTVAEVNEPVAKCFGYLGADDLPESNMVYNFAPFPMALHAQIIKDVQFYAQFLTTMDAFRGRQFITVLGSHDGLAQKQVRDILPPEELERLQNALVGERQGLCNYAKVAGGKQIVYEICGTPWCLVNGIEGATNDSLKVKVARYINCLCMGLVPRGMPGIYAQGLVGAENYAPPGGLDEYRTANRESFDVTELFAKLDNKDCREGMVFRYVMGVMKIRASLPQFDRNAPPPQVLEELDPAVMAVLLEAPKSSDPPCLVLVNVASEAKKAQVRGMPTSLLDKKLVDVLQGYGGLLHEGDPTQVEAHKDVADKTAVLPPWKPELALTMAPFEVLWLMPDDGTGTGKTFYSKK
eukprot:CAMPEP_0178399352 /NCGR_PEP_ID=MMETSP0689_2-20121128/15237_1 /TAXON_ID=160604 /ORGANISM="Amphidinium massartii, Strain CS-259" /LENGTH=777 /DNA_ID=CAMNT_0020020129 /DNA_START=104 /DNA_END=2437 /DNA_ORIENTATION=-